MRRLATPFRGFAHATIWNKISVIAFLMAISVGLYARLNEDDVSLAGMLSVIACFLIALGFYAGTRNKV